MSALPKEARVLPLQRDPAGVGALRTSLHVGRTEIITAGPNAEFAYIGSDPYNTNAYAGLVVPAAPTNSVSGRYLFVLARASFQAGQTGVRLVGIRQYAELVARIVATGSGPSPLAPGLPAGVTVTFRKEIVSPLWHPQDGDISWHVMVLSRGGRDTRNPQNADGLAYEDSPSPALLYQTVTVPPGQLYPSLTAYVPPNGGVPWGRPIGASLGNVHELRYHARSDQAERVLNLPVPVPSDVVLFASVRQNDPTLNPSLASGASPQVFSALSPEDQFVVAMTGAGATVQYGSIVGSLDFNENLEDTP